MCIRDRDEASHSYNLSAYLIAQIGKNYTEGLNNRITGKELLELAIDQVKDLQYQAGGMAVSYTHLDVYKRQARSNTKRLDEHDEILKSNSEMIGAIKELATEVKYMRGDLNETIERLNKLESKDGDKWEKFKWLIVAGLVTLILGYLAVSVGLK